MVFYFSFIFFFFFFFSTFFIHPRTTGSERGGRRIDPRTAGGSEAAEEAELLGGRWDGIQTWLGGEAKRKTKGKKRVRQKGGSAEEEALERRRNAHKDRINRNRYRHVFLQAIGFSISISFC